MEHPVILFDGVCNFCNGTVNFLIRRDKQRIFRFAPLQSGTGQRLIEKSGSSGHAEDSVLLIENGKIYSSSTAALRIARHLPWYWQWTQLFWILPKFLRDGAYRIFARNRYKWFGKKDQCMVPGPEIRNRFLG